MNDLIKWFYSNDNVHIMIEDIDSTNGTIEYVCYTDSLDECISELTNSFDVLNDEFRIFRINISEIVYRIKFEDIGSFDEKLFNDSHHNCIYNKCTYRTTTSKPSNKTPLPKHLKEILISHKNVSEFELSGKIKCTCGADTFNIYYKDYSVDCEYEGYYTKLQCIKCNHDYIIFDSYLHGWNGFVCNKHIPREKVPELNLLNCESCNCAEFKVGVHIFSCGYDDFCKELENEISKKQFQKTDWVNAFERIVISSCCEKCGYMHDNRFEYDTM